MTIIMLYQGHANPGFLASLSSGSLKQLQWSREAKSPIAGPPPLPSGPIADPDTDIDSDSFLSDLEVKSHQYPMSFIAGFLFTGNTLISTFQTDFRLGLQEVLTVRIDGVLRI